MYSSFIEIQGGSSRVGTNFLRNRLNEDLVWRHRSAKYKFNMVQGMKIKVV